ncbi:MAG: RNA polymerase sigma factor [Planctomycetes bacterium]|nr:RNA polymerase sigma factor [Planctomycetota bacterium]
MTTEFEQFIPDVFRWSYRVLGQYHDAMDVVQEVFLRWQRQCAKEVPAKPRGWLRRVSLNQCLDLKRARTTLTDETSNAAAKGEAPEVEPLDVAALRIDIQVALLALTETQRAVLVAKIYDSMTFAEIASEMEISIPTAKTHYLRAIRTVRPLLLKKWSHNDKNEL